MKEQRVVIGPEGPVAGIIQFVLITIAGILAFVYFIPLNFIVLKLIPGSLIYLVVLGHLALLGDNFPFAPPGGNWTPEKSRFTAGLGMVAIWAILSAAITLIMLYAFPKWPMSPLYLWFGVIAFTLTLLYGINWNGWPFKGHVHPWVMMTISAAIVLTLSSIVWIYLTNLDGTPFADTPMNHHGPLNVQWLTGYLVWAIAWFFIFSPVFTTQGWPFARLGHPGAALAQTIVAFGLAYVCWMGTLAWGWSPSFSFGTVASSIITWAVLYSWHLGFLGITKFTHASRAALAFILVVVIAVAWLGIMNVVLGPAAAAVASAKLPADINILTVYFNLCILAPIMIAHNAFGLRWPLSIPAPPGTPPPDQAV
jgi:hypothetical protein